MSLIEEHKFRRSVFHWWFKGGVAKTSGWVPQEFGHPSWLPSHRPERHEVGTGELGAMYRALRKGREDRKDKPGASDFYYGEMEMRRLSAATPLGERWLLNLYWAVSGYGLRAWRALICFAAFIGAMALLIQSGGFQTQRSYPLTVIYTLQTVLGIASNAPLTTRGEALRVIVRLIGPVLLGLAVLAMRGRVKR